MKEKTLRKIFGSIVILVTIIFLILSIIDNINAKHITASIELPIEPAFNKNNIAITFVPDKECLGYLSVTVASILKNISKDNNYDIIILENNLKSKCKKLFLEQLKPFKNVSVRFFNIDKFFEKYDKTKFSEINPFTKSYSRFFIPEIFNKYDKVIWLDIDTLVYTDLAELYNIDMENNMIAASRNMLINDWPPFKQTDSNFCSYLKDKINFNDCSKYINAGVILYNIKNCLEGNFTNLCLETLDKFKSIKSKSQEQDIINIVCEDKIKYIYYDYNLLASYITNESFISGEYLANNIIKNPKIVHFEDFKPWKYYKSYNSIYGYKWTEMSFNSPFFLNRKTYILKLKASLFKYNLYNKFPISKNKKKFYMEKISNIEKRIEYFTNI